MPAVGVVTGLSAESRIVRRALGRGDSVACAGASSARARDCALRLADAGTTELLSFGVAGGLDPALRPGALILAEATVTGEQRLDCDPAWRAAVAGLAGPGLALIEGGLAGSEGAVITPSDKARLHHETGALAVDMESHAVALVAAERGLPFLALRAIADPADRAIPQAALGAIGLDGRSRLGPVLKSLARRPWDLPALLALQRDFKTALLAMETAADRLKEPLFQSD